MVPGPRGGVGSREPAGPGPSAASSPPNQGASHDRNGDIKDEHGPGDKRNGSVSNPPRTHELHPEPVRDGQERDVQHCGNANEPQQTVRELDPPGARQPLEGPHVQSTGQQSQHENAKCLERVGHVILQLRS